MKKFLFLFAMCLMVLASSCSQNGPKEVSEKIQNGTELSQDDYTVIIQYLDEALKASPLMNEQALGDDIEASIKKADEWKRQYGYMEKFLEVILSVDPNSFNDKNKKLWDEINTKLAGDI